MQRLRGLRELVHDAIDEVTNLVEATHEAAARKPVDLLSTVESVQPTARRVDELRRNVARLVFDGVRGTNRRVQAIGDQAFSLVEQALGDLVASEPESPPLGAEQPISAVDQWIERAESAIDGLVGDFLADRGNPLAIRMRLRHGGRPLALDSDSLRRALPDASGKVCIFIHGLACSDSVWQPATEALETTTAQTVAEQNEPAVPGKALAFGPALFREHGFTPLYLRYNSGLHISENGRALALLLDELSAAYPGELEQIALVGHSMGGLVARSAVHYAEALGHPWLGKLQHVLSIGSPHLGAPLERAGNVLSAVLGAFDLAGTRVPAQVLRARSAGIKDLSRGSLLDEDWQGRDPDALFFEADGAEVSTRLVAGVAYGYVAARFRPGDDGLLGELLGDLLVHVPSASGQHRDPARRIPFHMGHLIEGAHHVALTTHPEVYRQLKRFLLECVAPPTPSPPP